MRNIIRAFRLERIKGRHTRTWLIMLLTAWLLPLLIFIFTLTLDRDPEMYVDKVVTSWFDQVFKGVSAFGMLFLPMAVVLLTAQVNSVEHKNNTWQLIETQPIPKWSIFIAKYCRVLVQVLAVILLFFAGQYMVYAVLYKLLHIDAKYYSLAVSWGDTLAYILNLFAGAMSFMALMFVLHINIRMTNLLSTCAIVSLFGYTMAKVFFPDIPAWVPLVQLEKVSGGISEVGAWLNYYARLSLVQSVFILVIGYLFYYYRNYKRYFFKQYGTLAFATATVLLGAAAAYWLSQPRYQSSYGRSVLAGHIDTDTEVKELLLVSEDGLPMAAIPVQENGDFRLLLDSLDIPMARYSLLQPVNRQPVTAYKDKPSAFFMTNGDSVHLYIKMRNGFTDMDISGDRRAESGAAAGIGFSNMEQLKWKIENDRIKGDEAAFLEQLEKSYRKDVKASGGYTTIDGYAVAPDVSGRNITLLNLKALSLWELYGKMKSKPELSASDQFGFINRLREALDFNDVSLVAREEFADNYFRYLNWNKEVTDLQKPALLEQIKDDRVRDAMRYQALRSLLDNNALDDSLVLAMYDAEIVKISSARYRKALTTDYASRKARTNFAVLPEFVFEDENGAQQSLRQFAGSYIVLDIWASWCPPCKANAPYFYDYADKFKDKNVKFVAVSVDQHINAWKTHKTRNPNIVNWHTSFSSDFIRYFGIKGIPRYILISPEGVPLQHELPMPGQSGFETVLKQYIK